jgi:hypothetical protein
MTRRLTRDSHVGPTRVSALLPNAVSIRVLESDTHDSLELKP